MKTILVFGHLPKYAGGKQSSGLANVIWQLATKMNNVGNPNYKVLLAATDIHQEKIIIDETEVLGWNRKLLFAIVLMNPHFVLYYLFKAIKLSVKFKFSLGNIFLKLLFYHYALKRASPDYVHLHGCTSVSFFEIYNFRKYKVIATIHGLSGQDQKIPGYRSNKRMEQAMNQLNFQWVAFISADLIRQWHFHYGTPEWLMIPISNAYDNGAFYYSKKTDLDLSDNNKKSISLATIASISELKGQGRVIEAIKLVESIKYKYVCIGGGNYEQVNKLKSAAVDAQIDFEYLGYQEPDQIREILKNVDYMILPSSSEGFGLVFLESIACGVPVILPKHLPIVHEPDLLNSENSVLLDDEKPQAIADVLIKLDKYHFNREKTANTVLNYGWKNIARKYLDNLNNNL